MARVSGKLDMESNSLGTSFSRTFPHSSMGAGGAGGAGAAEGVTCLEETQPMLKTKKGA